MLDLPPPYALLTPASGAAFDHAVAQAARGAGTLVWVPHPLVIDLAVVLEPAEPLAVARQVLFAGLLAAGEALAAICPPEKPIAFAWPDRLLYDTAPLGQARLASRGTDVPDWLVLGLHLDLSGEDGFGDFDSGDYVAMFARHLMLVLDTWQTAGPAPVVARFAARCTGFRPQAPVEAAGA